MKIVIVLCSLATFAIAVPVYQEHFIKSPLNNEALNTKRERKSTLPDAAGLSSEHGIEQIPLHSNKKMGQGTFVEGKSLRRPIIIKRKLGYHVYRDSDEEMAYAEPGEKCREQVKFKLCDHEPVLSSKNGIKSPTYKCMENHKTDNEMENSIKMAKEAVEHLQKDLKRMEIFSPKMSDPHIEDIESNTGLHHDIEIAREALEHIEQNFESANLDVNKVNDVQLSKSQNEERLTRWREAIENIHKNFEIVKNIEETFESNNYYSSLLSGSRKASELEEPKYSEGDVDVQGKIITDNLRNTDMANNNDLVLKSASNEVEIAELTPKTGNIDDIGKGAENDMFISPTENREENIQLHSDSLKSEFNFKDTHLRSDVGEIESTKHDTAVPKESIDYSPKNDLSETTYSEHEKTLDYHINDDQELLPKASSSSSESLHENIKIEEQNSDGKSEVIMKAVLPAIENRNPIIKMKSVKEILQNKKDKLKVATMNEENISDEVFFKSNNRNSPLEGLSFVPKSRDNEGSENLEDASLSGGEKNKYYNEGVEDEEKQSKDYNVNMRLSNDQLEKSTQLAPDNFATDRDVIELPHSLSLTEKNVFSNGQNEYKTHQVLYHSSKNSEPEIEDEEHFKSALGSTDEHQSIKSSETESAQPGSRMIQNQEFDNDLIMTVVQKEPELYKTVSEVSKEDILSDRDQSASQYIIEGQTSVAQSKEAYSNEPKESTSWVQETNNEDHILSLFKNVAGINSENHLSANNRDKILSEEPSIRNSQNQNEPLDNLDVTKHQNKELYNPLFMSLDKGNPEDHILEFSKSVPELYSDKLDIANNQHAVREEPSMRLSQNEDIKMLLNVNQEAHEPLWTNLDTTNQDSLTEETSMRFSENDKGKNPINENQEVLETWPMRLNNEQSPEDHTSQFPKSVPELQSDQMISLSSDNVGITYDQDAHREEASMRQSQTQSDKLQLNEYKEVPEYSSTRLDVENDSEGFTSPLFKSVPKLQSEPIVSLPTENGDNPNDQYRDEATMRLSESQNEKMQLDENNEEHDFLSENSDVKHYPEDRTWQFSKSVPELQSDPIAPVPTNRVDITNDQNYHNEEASMRLSKTEDEKLMLNKIEEGPEVSSKSSDIENGSEGLTFLLSKSVPELQSEPIVSMPTGKIDIIDDQHFRRGEGSMRLSLTQNEKLQLNDYHEGPEKSSITFDLENDSEGPTFSLSKSVPDLQSDLIVLMPSDKVDTSNNQHSHKEEENMRSSEIKEVQVQFPKSAPELQSDPIVSMITGNIDIINDQHFHSGETSMRLSQKQNEKLQLNEYQESSEHSPIRLDIEKDSEGSTFPLSKSVPEFQSDLIVLMPSEKVDTSNNQLSHKEEENMRSSEIQNEKWQLDENKEVQVQLPKSVSELQSDPIVSVPTDKVDITNDQHNKEEASKRLSQTEDEKLVLNNYEERPEHSSMRLDIENGSKNQKILLSKSVPELQFDAIVSMPIDKSKTTDDQHLHSGEMSMRLSQTQNEKFELSEYPAESEPLSARLDINSHQEEQISPLFKSVPELQPDPMVSLPTDKVDIIEEQNSHNEESSMRVSQAEDEKFLLNEYEEGPEHLSTSVDIENNSEGPTFLLSKSVPELQSDSITSMLTDKVDIINDKHSQEGEANMRSSESQNNKMQFEENQEPFPIKLHVVNNEDESTLQFKKSVPELQSDLMVSMPKDKVDITNDQHSHTGEESMRLSQTENEKLQVKENQAEPLPTRPDIKNHQEERTSQFSKSISDLDNDPIIPMPTDKVEMTIDKNSPKEVPSMRLSQSQNENLPLTGNQEVHSSESLTKMLDTDSNDNEHISLLPKSVPELGIRLSESQNEKKQLHGNQELHELLPKSDNSHYEKEHLWQYSKSVPELHSDQIVSMPTNIVTNAQHSQVDKNMRLSQTQNEKFQFTEVNQESHEPLSMRLDITNRPEEHTSQFSKSVSELYNDPMVSLPTDTVEVANEHHSPKEEGNMRVSQNQNEKLGFYDNPFQQPIKLDIENNPEHWTSHVLKSASEFYINPSDKNDVTNEKQFFKEETRLSQNQDDREQTNLNYHLLPLSSRFNIEKHLEDDSPQEFKSVQDFRGDYMLPMAANRARFSYEQNPIKEQTNMRLAQNQNEVQYSEMSLGFNNEYRDRKDNEEHVMDDFMHMNLAQQVHKNHDPTLRSNERQFLNHKFKSMPEYKMLTPASQFELNNGQNTNNEHMNMRTNQQQGREPEPTENHNLHNSFSMPWNTDQHQDPSPKSFKSIADFDHPLHISNEFDNEQFMPHDVSKMGNFQEYRSRPQLFDGPGHNLDNTQSTRWFQTKQNNDNFANYYKAMPEVHKEYMNPRSEHLHRVAVNHRLNDANVFSSHDFPSSITRFHDHNQNYHQEKSSNVGSSVEPSMHMNRREQFEKSASEFNNMHFNHPHGTARFGTALPIAGASPGAVGVFPTANAGGCGIPLLLSCSPSVVSGSLARSHIAGPVFKSVDENFKYYIKRNAKDIPDVPVVKVQKAPLPHNHETGAISEI